MQNFGLPEFPIKNYDQTRETNSNFHQRNFISYQIQGTAHLSNTEGIYKTSRMSAQQVVAGTNKKKQKLIWDFFYIFEVNTDKEYDRSDENPR